MSATTLPTVSDLLSGLRLLTRLPPILRRPIRAGEVHKVLRYELTHRAENFLQLMRDGVFRNPASPYLRLLKLVGCELGDLNHLVVKEGLEGALQVLFRKGVYLTVEESKGRRAVVRGSARFHVIPDDMRNPALRVDLVSTTGGSRGPGSPVPIELSTLRDHAMEIFVDLEVKDGFSWVGATWSVPGGGNLKRLIYYSLCGLPITGWFSLVGATAPGLHSRYLWSARLLRWSSRLGGVTLPQPIHVGLQDPGPILGWISDVLRAGKTPYLHAYVSCVTRICQTAMDSNVSLAGVHFAMGGEPITPGRLALIEKAGARAYPHYSSEESGHVGRGCLAPEAADEVHVIQNRYGLIQPGDDTVPELPRNALLITAITPRARVILINFSLGDEATLTNRRCGCPLERIGWKTHLHTIRSFEKLTAGGMTFYHADLIRVLEEVLPRKFGGGPTDYQLLEIETANSEPSVRLRVHPRLGPMDPEQVRQTFLDTIGAGSGVERVMMLVWRDAGLPIVEREAPRVTGGGKILHVHLDRPNRLSVDNAD